MKEAIVFLQSEGGVTASIRALGSDDEERDEDSSEVLHTNTRTPNVSIAQASCAPHHVCVTHD